MHSQIPSHQTHSLRLSLLPLPPPRYVQNPDPLISSLSQTLNQGKHMQRDALQTPRFVKNHQEESSLARLEEIFVSVHRTLYFLLTAKKSGRDFQRSSGVTNNNHKSHSERKGKKSSVPSRDCLTAAVRIWLISAHFMPHQVYSSPFCADIKIYFGLWKHEMQSTCKPHWVCELQIPGIFETRALPCWNSWDIRRTLIVSWVWGWRLHVQHPWQILLSGTSVIKCGMTRSKTFSAFFFFFFSKNKL